MNLSRQDSDVNLMAQASSFHQLLGKNENFSLIYTGLGWGSQQWKAPPSPFELNRDKNKMDFDGYFHKQAFSPAPCLR